MVETFIMVYLLVGGFFGTNAILSNYTKESDKNIAWVFGVCLGTLIWPLAIVHTIRQHTKKA